MPKFYVRSKDFQTIISARCPRHAAMTAFERSPEIARMLKAHLAGEEVPEGFEYGYVTVVSERGFDVDEHPPGSNRFFPSGIFV
jgi:hypothetical protein